MTPEQREIVDMFLGEQPVGMQIDTYRAIRAYIRELEAEVERLRREIGDAKAELREARATAYVEGVR